MRLQALLFGLFTMATPVVLVSPAGAADSGILGFYWGKNIYYFEPMPTGPQPVRNLSRRRNGTSNPTQLVGDFRNPNLTPEAAALVKERGDRAKAGEPF